MYQEMICNLWPALTIDLENQINDSLFLAHF